ncbi:MAG: hypothetical protein HY814_09085 [Candidatus Riflebacteria bacterium]|nr:hypothetical protein [Candidatus Riflebacteria bacterium]
MTAALLGCLGVTQAEEGSLMGSRVMRGHVPFRKDRRSVSSRPLASPIEKARNPEEVAGFLLEPVAPEPRPQETVSSAIPVKTPGGLPVYPEVGADRHDFRTGVRQARAAFTPARYSGLTIPAATQLPIPASPAYIQLAQAPGAPAMPPLPPPPEAVPPPPATQPSAGGLPGWTSPSRVATAATTSTARVTGPADLDQKLNLDLRDTEIKHFIKILSEQTRTNWVFDPAMTGKINMLGPQEMTLREAQYLLKSILEFKGFTIEEIGNIRRVVPRTEGKFRQTELRLTPYKLTEGYPLSDDKLVTQLIRVKYRNVNEVRGILVNFAKDAAAILPYAPTNSLFITDNGTYIHRLMKIVEELDTPDLAKRVVRIPLQFAFAKTILQPLGEILKQTRAARVGATSASAAPAAPEGAPPPVPAPGAPVSSAPGQPTILVDEADNMLMVIAYPDDLDYVQDVVRMLDRDPDHVPEIRVVPLRNSDPDTVKGLVSEAFKSDPGLASSIKNFACIADKRTGSIMLSTYSPKMLKRVLDLVQKLDIPVVTAGAAIRVYRLEFAEAKKVAEVLSGLATGDEEISSSVVSSGTSTGAAASAFGALGAPPKPFGAPAAPGASTSAGQAAKKATVIADEATNSLVIVATREKFAQLTAVIKELDIVRPQVLVEVLIVRLDLDRARHLGLDFNAVSANGDSRPFAIGSTGQLTSLFSAAGVRTGLNIGLLDSGNFDISAAARGDLGQLSKIGILTNLLATDTKANILSAPKLLTADNEEAKITVGSQVRIPQGSTLNAINTITNFVTEDLGIIMQLTPRITKNDFVSMKIRAQIKNLIPGANVAGLPVISNSDLENHITVENQATIVMGGLIQEEERLTENRIPLLSSIPVLGKLFRDTSKTKTKSNLLVFMTPHILRTSDSAKSATKRVSPFVRHVDIKAKKRRGAEADPATLLKAMNEAK